MGKSKPARPTLTAFVKVNAKKAITRRMNNRNALKQLSGMEVLEELSVQGVAILSDN